MFLEKEAAKISEAISKKVKETKDSAVKEGVNLVDLARNLAKRNLKKSKE